MHLRDAFFTDLSRSAPFRNNAKRMNASRPESSDVLVIDNRSRPRPAEPNIDIFWNSVVGQGESDAPNCLDLGATAGRRRNFSKCGVRQFLTEEEGTGYWDFFKPTDFLHVSVTTATYRKNTWLQIEGDCYFKVRLLLSGRLLDANARTLAEGPHAVVYLSPGPGRDGYFISKGIETRLIVLHCRPKLLTDALGLEPSALPPPFDRLYGPPQPGSLHHLALGPDILNSAKRILESRYEMPAQLRVPFLESMAIGICCEILGDLTNRDFVQRAQSQFSARDLNSIYEARDYLSQHFAAPPTIPQLARMVGINQTKLKVGFKAVVGITVFNYIVRRRMERASELLITQDYPIETVAHMVGYRHAANFSCAFKRHYGCQPRAWKRRSTEKHSQ